MDFGDFTRSRRWRLSCPAATLLQSGNRVTFAATARKPPHHLRTPGFSQGKSQLLFPPAAQRLTKAPRDLSICSSLTSWRSLCPPSGPPNRGTGGGVVEGALSGAAMGFAIGGPIGAGVGALVGLGIGLGEMIAGVESPRDEAKRLVQTQYHISINNSMADQIVALAGQKYGNTISVAVRSPEVRQMLGLYAAGTGQKFRQSSDVAHGASLIENQGRLSQGAEYQYGNAYSYASNLPVYGGVSTQPLPNPGGNFSLSFNVEGASTAQFLNGQVFTPENTQSNFAAAAKRERGPCSKRTGVD